MQSLGFVFTLLCLDLFQPRFDQFIRFVTCIVKALPHAVVGHAALVGLLPGVAQVAHGFLLFAATQRFFNQLHSLDGQIFADLVGAPTLPAFQFTRCAQGVLGGRVELFANVATVFFERGTHSVGCGYTGFAMAFV